MEEEKLPIEEGEGNNEESNDGITEKIPYFNTSETSNAQK